MYLIIRPENEIKATPDFLHKLGRSFGPNYILETHQDNISHQIHYKSDTTAIPAWVEGPFYKFDVDLTVSEILIGLNWDRLDIVTDFMPILLGGLLQEIGDFYIPNLYNKVVSEDMIDVISSLVIQEYENFINTFQDVYEDINEIDNIKDVLKHKSFTDKNLSYKLDLFGKLIDERLSTSQNIANTCSETIRVFLEIISDEEDIDKQTYLYKLLLNTKNPEFSYIIFNMKRLDLVNNFTPFIFELKTSKYEITQLIQYATIRAIANKSYHKHREIIKGIIDSLDEYDFVLSPEIRLSMHAYIKDWSRLPVAIDKYIRTDKIKDGVRKKYKSMYYDNNYLLLFKEYYLKQLIKLEKGPFTRLRHSILVGNNKIKTIFITTASAFVAGLIASILVLINTSRIKSNTEITLIEKAPLAEIILLLIFMFLMMLPLFSAIISSVWSQLFFNDNKVKFIKYFNKSISIAIIPVFIFIGAVMYSSFYSEMLGESVWGYSSTGIEIGTETITYTDINSVEISPCRECDSSDSYIINIQTDQGEEKISLNKKHTQMKGNMPVDLLNLVTELRNRDIQVIMNI